MKHKNTSIIEVYEWKWSQYAINDNTVFIASCITYNLAYGTKWLDAYERERLGHIEMGLEGVIDNVKVLW